MLATVISFSSLKVFFLEERRLLGLCGKVGLPSPPLNIFFLWINKLTNFNHMQNNKTVKFQCAYENQ